MQSVLVSEAVDSSRVLANKVHRRVAWDLGRRKRNHCESNVGVIRQQAVQRRNKWNVLTCTLFLLKRRRSYKDKKVISRVTSSGVSFAIAIKLAFSWVERRRRRREKRCSGEANYFTVSCRSSERRKQFIDMHEGEKARKQVSISAAASHLTLTWVLCMRVFAWDWGAHFFIWWVFNSSSWVRNAVKLFPRKSAFFCLAESREMCILHKVRSRREEKRRKKRMKGEKASASHGLLSYSNTADYMNTQERGGRLIKVDMRRIQRAVTCN